MYTIDGKLNEAYQNKNRSNIFPKLEWTTKLINRLNIYLSFQLSSQSRSNHPNVLIHFYLEILST